MSHADTLETDSLNALFEKGCYFDTDSAFHTPGYPIPGMEGEPIPYTLYQDTIITGIVFIAFLLLCYVLNRGHKLILHQIKNFFTERERNNLFVETGSEFRYQLFLLAHTILMTGLLFFRLRLIPGEPLKLNPSWFPLSICIGICLLFYLFKFLLYTFVNWVFFEEKKYDRWNEIYTLLLSLQGLVLFPLVLLSIYFQLSDANTEIIFLCTIVFIKMLLFYKGFSIFFAKIRGLLCNILYFCTLEMIPSLILWRIMSEINEVWNIKF